MSRHGAQDRLNAKKSAAEKAVSLIKTGMIIGLGSGSTSTLAIRELGERVKQGLDVKAVASSVKSEMLARELAIPMFEPGPEHVIDIALDGADHVDKAGNLIKGGGGSLLREKILAYASRRFHVMIDDSKIVGDLGGYAVPVEILSFAAELTLRHLRSLNCEAVLRKSGSQNFVSDNGNFIADCKFDHITDPVALDVKLKMIPGVIETGLFPARIVSSIIIGYADGNVKEVPLNV